jgi:hypothetical protein
MFWNVLDRIWGTGQENDESSDEDAEEHAER